MVNCFGTSHILMVVMTHALLGCIVISINYRIFLQEIDEMRSVNTNKSSIDISKSVLTMRVVANACR